VLSDPLPSPSSAESKLKRINASGGPVQTLSDAPVPLGWTWSRDGVIVFGASLASPLLRIHAGGGTPAPASDVNVSASERIHESPLFLPDGRHFLFAAMHSPNQGRVHELTGSTDDLSKHVNQQLRLKGTPIGSASEARRSVDIHENFRHT
jgi:hypothetical protein